MKMSKKTIAKIFTLWKKHRNIWEISQLTGVTEREVLEVVNNPGNGLTS
jgi:hypothetical protein